MAEAAVDVAVVDEADVDAAAVADVDEAVEADEAGVVEVAGGVAGGVTTAGRGSADATHALFCQVHQRLALFCR